MRTLIIILSIISFVCFGWQCTKEKQVPSKIELYGTITDKQTNLPLKGVIVQLSRQASMYVFDVAKTHTDTLGKYNLKFNPDNSSSYALNFAKEYYADDTRYVDTYKAKQEFNIQLKMDSTNWVDE